VQAEEVVHRQSFVERQQVGLKPPKRVLGLILEDVIGELVVLAEPAARNRLQGGKILLGRGPLALVMGIAEEVAEPIGIAIIAPEQGLERIALEARLVAVLEQLEKPVVSALLRRRRGLRVSHCGRGNRDQRYREDQAPRKLHKRASRNSLLLRNAKRRRG
jgi:hypothetical protein